MNYVNVTPACQRSFHLPQREAAFLSEGKIQQTPEDDSALRGGIRGLLLINPSRDTTGCPLLKDSNTICLFPSASLPLWGFFFCKLWESLDKAMQLIFHFSPVFISNTFLNRCYENAQLWVPVKGSLSGFDTWVLRHLPFLR